MGKTTTSTKPCAGHESGWRKGKSLAVMAAGGASGIVAHPPMNIANATKA